MSIEHLSFAEAREYMHDIGLINTRQWKQWSKGNLADKGKRPNFIPSNPDSVYKFNGWKSWNDWLGTDKTIKYLPFEEARAYVRSLHLKNSQEWQKFYQGKMEERQKPDNIPWNPQTIYPDEWHGMKDWLGSEWRDFDEAKEFIRSLNLSGQKEWRGYSKGELEGYDLKPYDIPSDPKRVYGDEWIDLADWLGTERKRTGSNQIVDDTWFSFEDAKVFVHSLGLSSFHQWKAYIAGELNDFPARPINIPKAPDYVYRNNGWDDWDDWLGGDESFIIKDSTQESIVLDNISEDFLKLKQYYHTSPILVNLLDRLYSETHKKSLIELDLPSQAVDEIENIFLNYSTTHRQNSIQKALIGLLFLFYVAHKLKDKITYSQIWSHIVNGIKESTTSSYFLDNFFIGEKNPHAILIESLEYACKIFNLRNDFSSKGEHHYIRNTILLQIGLINNSLDNLKLLLSNYNLPIVIAELLDSEEENYSREFSDGWRVLRRYRDNILSDTSAKSLLEQNIWFKHL